MESSAATEKDSRYMFVSKYEGKGTHTLEQITLGMAFLLRVQNGEVNLRQSGF